MTSIHLEKLSFVYNSSVEEFLLDLIDLDCQHWNGIFLLQRTMFRINILVHYKNVLNVLVYYLDYNEQTLS